MRVKVLKEKGYNIHTIKVDKYKSTTMNIIFRKELKKEEISSYAILSRLITESSKKYPRKRNISIELERLYNSFIFSNISIEGNSLCFEITYDFLNPKYCEKGYLEDVLRFPFELLMNPNVTNNEFDLDSYNIAVNYFKTVLQEEKEYSNAYALKRSLECMDSSSKTAYSHNGYLSDLDHITRASLYEDYKRLFKDFKVDVYISGNVEMDLVCSYIRKFFKLNNKPVEIEDMYVHNKTKKEIDSVVEYGDYEQASLVMIYNLVDLSKRERDIVLPIFNLILGGNDLTSKLYLNVREKNSLCYSIGSYFNKYGQLLFVRAGISEDNKDKCVDLINKCIKEMVAGKFDDNSIIGAKKAKITLIKMQNDSTWSIINNQINADVDNVLLGNKLINEIKTVTKKEIVNLAKKVKPNIVYMLCKEVHDENN